MSVSGVEDLSNIHLRNLESTDSYLRDNQSAVSLS